MSFTELKRVEIKKYIYRKIAVEDENFIEKTMDNFDISITTVKRYLKNAVLMGDLIEDETAACGYRLVTQVHEKEMRLEADLDELCIFQQVIKPYLMKCNKAACFIWEYVCLEMLNNVLEHSKGTKLTIRIEENAFTTSVMIIDDGIGVFDSLREYMSKEGWHNPTIEDAVIELYKGKMTSRPESHAGEGIFFSSKLLDAYVIVSKEAVLKWGIDEQIQLEQSRLVRYYTALNKIGTGVVMRLENETSRESADVFNYYTDIDEGFVCTHIPMKHVCFGENPIARSQARRLCKRFEQFKEVIIDFDDIEFMGQGFSDEIFRVYATAHPEVRLRPINMTAAVYRMVKHVGRGHLPENVVIET